MKVKSCSQRKVFLVSISITYQCKSQVISAKLRKHIRKTRIPPRDQSLVLTDQDLINYSQGLNDDGIIS